MKILDDLLVYRKADHAKNTSFINGRGSMTSYSPEGLACLWESGARECEAQARKLEATVRKWKTRDNTHAVTMVAYEWQMVAEVLESCAYDIEKHYLGVSHSHEENLEHAKRPGIAGKHYCGYREGHDVSVEKARKWKGKVDDLRASAQLWKDKASALLGDPKAQARLHEAEAREWEEKASDLKAGAQKLRATVDKWAEKAQELEDQSREAAAKAGDFRNSH